MDQSDVIYQDLKKKELVYEILERDYRKKKQGLEAQYEDLQNRRFQLSRIMDEEADKMNAFLHRSSHSYEDGHSFYQNLQQLSEESSATFQRRVGRLQTEEEQLTQTYRREREQLDDEICILRRLYANSNE